MQMSRILRSPEVELTAGPYDPEINSLPCQNQLSGIGRVRCKESHEVDAGTRAFPKEAVISRTQHPIHQRFHQSAGSVVDLK